MPAMDTNIDISLEDLRAEYEAIIASQARELAAARAQVGSLLRQRHEATLDVPGPPA